MLAGCLIAGCADPELPPVGRVGFRLGPVDFGGGDDVPGPGVRLGQEVREVVAPRPIREARSTDVRRGGAWTRSVLVLPPAMRDFRDRVLALDVARNVDERLLRNLPQAVAGAFTFQLAAVEQPWFLRSSPRNDGTVKVAMRRVPSAPIGVVRLTSLTPAPARLESRPFDVPPGGRLALAFGLATAGRGPVGSPTRFRAAVDCAWARERTVVDRTVDGAGASRWHEASADFPRGGRGCRLVLETRAAAVTDPVWAVPRFDVPGADPTAPRPPHVVLVSLDTVRADHLSGYGYPRATTPAIDAALIARGTLFEQVSTTYPMTHHAHASLFTGRYPAALSTDGVLPASRRIPTLARALGEAGYLTLGVTEDALVGHEFGLTRGFDQVVEHAFRAPPEERGHPVFKEGVAALHAYGDRPVFLFLHTYKAHAPYEPSPAYRDRFAARPAPLAAGFDLPPARRADFDAYDASIREADDALGGFLRELDHLGLAERTLVVLVSDHGEAFGEHGMVEHGMSPHEPALRVPLVLRGPGVPAGRRVASPASLVDVAPTILDLLGLAPLPRAQGRSLAPALGADASLPDVPIFFQWIGAESGGVRIGARKLWQGSRVFDLLSDRSEVHPGRLPAGYVATLRLAQTGYGLACARLRAEDVPPAGDAVAPTLSPETERSLRALGYLGEEGAPAADDSPRAQ